MKRLRAPCGDSTVSAFSRVGRSHVLKHAALQAVLPLVLIIVAEASQGSQTRVSMFVQAGNVERTREGETASFLIEAKASETEDDAITFDLKDSDRPAVP